jgi:hypothetical protein
VISGRLTPEVQATERAEVGGSVIDVEVGERVRRGQTL